MDWTTWKPATCLPDCFCEAARTGSWILEPVNTWTNLFFMLAGIFFILRAQRLTTKTNQLNSIPLFPRLYGFAMIFVGLGSFFYHASQTFVGQWFDVFGMFLISMFYVFYNFYRINWIQKKQFFIYYLISCIFLGVIIIYFPEARRWLFGISLAFILIQSIWIQKRFPTLINRNYIVGALVSYLFAQTVWVLDKHKIWCDPYAWMNGHGIWHIFSGLAAVLIYFYFQSEKQQTANT